MHATQPSGTLRKPTHSLNRLLRSIDRCSHAQAGSCLEGELDAGANEHHGAGGRPEQHARPPIQVHDHPEDPVCRFPSQERSFRSPASFRGSCWQVLRSGPPAPCGGHSSRSKLSQAGARSHPAQAWLLPRPLGLHRKSEQAEMEEAGHSRARSGLPNACRRNLQPTDRRGVRLPSHLRQGGCSVSSLVGYVKAKRRVQDLGVIANLDTPSR